MERYTIRVDLTAKENSLHYVVINDHERFTWMKLSQELRNGLIDWTGSNNEAIR